MPSVLLEGEPGPADDSLPASALAELGTRDLGVYIHVPFCATRCGYCDFNTYTVGELGVAADPSAPAGPAAYVQAALKEIDLARRVLGDPGRPVDTVFFGGGTPTLLPVADQVSLLHRVEERFGFAAEVEVSTEANPDSVTAASLAALREGGVNRISFGMQSAVPWVLSVLDRTHDPEGVPRAVRWAREAGFEQVSLDLIYGTPGESLADWEASLDAALACAPDHVSAYALIVEDGTALARRVRRGEIASPDDDEMAEKYLMADEVLTKAGLSWYELSNWARDDAAQCRHSLVYWRGHDWWGIGPGAHSHIGGVRWWNVKHPSAYSSRLGSGVSPAEGRELLDDETRRVERILLETRLAAGLPLSVLDEGGRAWVPDLVEHDMVGLVGDRLVLTAKGRLLADAVVRDLVP